MRIIDYMAAAVLAASCSLSTVAFAQTAAELSVEQLPKVTLLGKSFYYYEAHKGESMAGIANRFGWDLTTLEKVNREVITPLDNGTLLYYPAPSVSKKNNKAEQGKADVAATQSANNNAAASASAAASSAATTSAGSRQQSAVTDGAAAAASGEAAGQEAIYYEVEEDESLYGIAKKFNTTVEDLFRLNPGLAANSLREGERIKVVADTRSDEVLTEKVTEPTVHGVTQYKVKRGDTWSSIAEKNGISVALLREANPAKSKLSRGEMIVIPEVAEMEVEKSYVAEDPRESTPEGRQELYNEVHDIQLPGASGGEDGIVEGGEVSVAIVLSDVSSNRDMEFARGALLAVNEMKERPFRTRLTILDGQDEAEGLTAALEEFQPTLIITTADKDLPATLTDYARLKSVELVNAFDVKDESYINNPYVIQYLAPTSYFNEEVAQYISSTYSGYKLIIAGSMEGSDSMGESIVKALAGENSSNATEMEIEELPEAELEMDSNYLVYATPSKREDAKNLLEKVSVMRQRNPLCDIRVIGRPSWITFADAQRDLFGDNYVLMPTRFYFNAEEPRSRSFINDFKSLYGHTPIKSYPVYSATAYDILTYLVPNLAAAGGDFNAVFTNQPTLQSEIDLKRVNNWGGIVNPTVFLIDFGQFGTYNRISIP